MKRGCDGTERKIIGKGFSEFSAKLSFNLSEIEDKRVHWTDTKKEAGLRLVPNERSSFDLSFIVHQMCYISSNWVYMQICLIWWNSVQISFSSHICCSSYLLFLSLIALKYTDTDIRPLPNIMEIGLDLNIALLHIFIWFHIYCSPKVQISA